MDPVEREQRILEHYPLVRSIAGRMVRRFPSNVELDELVSIGVVGLIDALERFDEGRGVPFRAFAEIRIRGAIVDALRSSDHVPRSVRRKSARIEAERTRLRLSLGREPTRDEMASALQMTPAAYDALVSDAEIRRLISLESVVDDEVGLTIGDQVSDGGPSVEDRWIDDETTEEVIAAVQRLPEKERKVVMEYYFEEKQLRAIGAEMGVTESRVCQIRTQAVGRIEGWVKKGKIPRPAKTEATDPPAYGSSKSS